MPADSEFFDGVVSGLFISPKLTVLPAWNWSFLISGEVYSVFGNVYGPPFSNLGVYSGLMIPKFFLSGLT